MTALPFKFEKEPKDKAEERLKFYNAPGCSVRDNLVVTNPGGVILPKDFVPIAEGIYNFELRPGEKITYIIGTWISLILLHFRWCLGGDVPEMWYDLDEGK